MTHAIGDELAEIRDRYDLKGIAVAWYTPESWRQLQAVSAIDLGSYEDFVRKANRQIRDIEARGTTTTKFTIDIDHMAAWCRHHGYAIDVSSRAAYGSMLACNDGKLFDISTPIDMAPGVKPLNRVNRQ
jgi:hypothetical protein